MPKNYYIILGIPADSSQAEIKSAYRRLAKEFHPDHSGTNTPFLSIQEAYSVLGDPVRRRDYDRLINQQRARRIGSVHRAHQPVWSGAGEPEPLIPQPPQVPGRSVSPLRPFNQHGWLRNSPVDRLSGLLRENDFAEGGLREELSATIDLTPEQAALGGQVQLLVPARLRCSGCGGTGRLGFYECWKCSGLGVLQGEYPVMVSYPPGIADHHTVRLSVGHGDGNSQSFLVNFRVRRR